MKSHLLIKTTEELKDDPPYWESIISDKKYTVSSFFPEADNILLKKYNLPFWLTYNYSPSSKKWSDEEIKSGLNRVYRLVLKQNTTIPTDLINELKLLPQIEYVQVGNIGRSDIPETNISESKSLTKKYRDYDIFLEEAHFFSKGDSSVKIAILDTGFETDHKELDHAMLPGKDFVNIINGSKKFIGDYLGYDDIPEDDVGHGTHVAGIIGGKGIKMPVGVVPKCKILPVKVLGALKKENQVVGAGLVDNINTGIKWAVDQGADVINMSLGIKHTGGGLPHEEVIQYALEKGVSVIAASGNDGKNDKYYPGALPGVIAVGAAGNNTSIAGFSTFGGHVSLIAPGVNVYSSSLNNGYAVLSGTSQASPFVAGAVALLKSYAKQMGATLHDRQIKYLLKHTSDRISSQFKDQKAGYGLLNILDAIKLLNCKNKQL